MTIRHLNIFHTVCKHKSMTLAAKELFLTQSAVSQTIKELEEHYQTVLFDRFPRRIELTQAGKALDEIAAEILLSYDSIEEKLAKEDASGTLKVGANLSAGTVLIHDFLNKFEKIHPDTEVEVVVTRASVLEKKLLDNELDLALMEDSGREKDLIVEPFYNDRIVFVGPKDCPFADKRSVSIEKLCKQKLLLREHGAGVRDQFEHIVKARGLMPNVAWESSSTTTLVRAVINKKGIAVLPYLLVKDYIGSGKIKEIKVKDASLSRVLNIVYYNKKHLSSVALDFMEIVKQSSFKK